MRPGAITAIATMAVLLALAAPLAAAQAPASMEVHLASADGAWNGATARPTSGDEEVALFVPPGARLQQVAVTLDDGSTRDALWRASGASALLVSAPPNATRAFVRYDFVPDALTLVSIVAPDALARLDVNVEAPEGLAPQADAVTFELRDGAHVLTLTDVESGRVLAVRLVDPARASEIGVLATLALLSLVTLAAGISWHRLRPPLAGREAARFMDHLAEMQARALPVGAAFLVFNVLYFVAGLRSATVWGVPLVAPVWGVARSLSARAFEALAERLVPEGVALVVLRPVDAVLVQVQMTLFLAFVTVLPLMLYEAARFIGPALLPRERRGIMRSVPLVLGLFLGGAAIGLLVMAPLMIRTLYSYAPNLGAAPLLAVSDLISFTLVIVVALGLAFELPVVMYVLGRLGVVGSRGFRKYLRHAIVAIFLVAGIITPDPSVVSQTLVAAPVTALYLAGIMTARWGERKREAALA